MKRLLGIFAALLILIQTAGMISLSATPTKRDHPTEVHQKIIPQASFAEVAPQIILPTFLFYWIAQRIAPGDAPSISYHNCQAFLVNPFRFNHYYVHLSALAP